MSDSQGLIDRHLLHYRVIAKLGAGGMGEVYLAFDNKLDREVALKVVPEDFAADPRPGPGSSRAGDSQWLPTGGDS